MARRNSSRIPSLLRRSRLEPRRRRPRRSVEPTGRMERCRMCGNAIEPNAGVILEAGHCSHDCEDRARGLI